MPAAEMLSRARRAPFADLGVRDDVEKQLELHQPTFNLANALSW
ncbi:hypothetical protein [Actinosynnema sp. ALI-1.44]|nr:hypothetical protein [Actinosynnema sp. ALI-1.44]